MEKKEKKEVSRNNIEKMNADITKMNKEHKKEIKEMRHTLKEITQSMKEANKRMEHAEKKIANSNERIEGISRSNGEFCEEYFINSFKENPTFLGERYERVLEYHKPEPVVINDEYDLILRNGSTVVLIEMKYKAGTSDVGKMFSKLHTYRANFPMFKDYKTYLALASFRFPKAVRVKAAERGIVLLEQRGDKIEVISENVRAW